MATYLSTLNAHERDQHIEFYEPTHVYTVKGDSNYTSVTTWNHSHFGSFDANKIIGNMVKSGKLEDPTYKYYGKTPEDIKKMWAENGKEASSAGTQTHLHIEHFYNRIDVVDDSTEYAYFQNFVKDYPQLEAYRTEWCVYDEDLKIAGSIDMVYRDKNTGEFYIYDWKRSKRISFESFNGAKAKTECINHLDDSNFWHYSLQLNVYRKILRSHYGIDAKQLCLVILHPNNCSQNYEIVELPFLDEEVEQLWEYRKNQLV
jgi:hypothetical protein